MRRPSDSREALIAEALGDFVKVLDRIDALKPTLEKSCSDLKFTADNVLGNIEPFQRRMVEMALQMQNRTLGHIAEHVNLVARRTVAEQTVAMQESARQIFKDEVGPPLERVAGQLREANLRKQPSWQAWLTHAAVALSAAGWTWVLMVYLAPTGAAETRQVTSAPSPGRAEPVAPPSRARDRR